MGLRQPTAARATLMLLLALAAALLPAAPALAHNGLGGAASDYRTEITGYDGDPTGFSLRVVELGSRMELQRTTASEVVVLGYDGEPYLRLSSAGITENVNSRAHYLNLSRFASTMPPATAGPDAPVDWVSDGSGDTIRWHDHRAHWMSPTPREDVSADPDVERVIFPANRIELVVDGKPVTALVRVTWLPPPDRTIWLATGAVLGGAVATVLVFSARARRAVPLLAGMAALAAIVGQGDNGVRIGIGIGLVLVAIVAASVRRPIVSVIAAVGACVLTATRLDVFDHELLAGFAAAVWQRVAVSAAIALGLGVTAAAVVDALSPTPTSTPTPLSEPSVPT